MPKGEVSFLATYLFTGEGAERAVARIDHQIDRLPGLAGLKLVQSAVASLADERPRPD